MLWVAFGISLVALGISTVTLVISIKDNAQTG